MNINLNRIWNASILLRSFRESAREVQTYYSHLDHEPFTTMTKRVTYSRDNNAIGNSKADEAWEDAIAAPHLIDVNHAVMLSMRVTYVCTHANSKLYLNNSNLINEPSHHLTIQHSDSLVVRAIYEGAARVTEL